MRILFVCHRFLPEGYAGVEVYTHDLAGELRGRGHRVLAYTASGGGVARRDYEIDGTPVVALGGDDVRERETVFAGILEKYRPEVIHYHHFSGHAPGYVALARGRGIPQVMTLHDYWAVCPRIQLLMPDLQLCSGPAPGKCADCQRAARVLSTALGDGSKFAEPGFLPAAVRKKIAALLGRKPGLIARRFGSARRLRRLTKTMGGMNLLLAPTVALAERVKRFHELEIKIVPYGIILPQEPAPRAPEKELTIGYIGSLDWHKGLHVMLQSLGGISETVKLSVWGLPGPASYQRYCWQLVQALPANLKVAWHEERVQDKINAVYSGIDLLVMPSLWYENYPLVLAEAMARGVPVIASDFSALRETLAAVPGSRYFPPGDVLALRAVLRELINNRESLIPMRRAQGQIKEMAAHATELLGLYQGQVGG